MSFDQADIFLLPLLDGGYGVGQIVDVAGAPEGTVFCALADRRVTGTGPTGAIAQDEIIALLLLQSAPLADGTWPIVALEPLPDVQSLFDWRGARNAGYSDLSVQDSAVVEALVNACHGLLPWDGFAGADFFNQFLIDPERRPKMAQTAEEIALESRLLQQIAFLTEADRLKTVLRGTPIFDGSRRENSGEHSWHIALFALILAEHAHRPVNVHRVIEMLLIHDLVEIDVGDNPIHGNHDVADTVAKEAAAAERIFGLLPVDQADRFRALWQEFEAAETDDAIFAKSVDRVQPVLANLETGGGSWIDYKVTAAQLESRVGTKVSRGAPALWTALKSRIDRWFDGHA